MKFKREKETQSLAKRLIVEVLIVVSLFPILLGAIANMQNRYRLLFENMRREHRAAMARQAVIMAVRQMTQGSPYP